MRKGLRKWNKTNNRGGKRFGNRILMGFAASEILLTGAISGISYLMGNNTFPLEKASIIGKVGLALTSFAGCFLAAKLSEKRRLLNATIVGCLFLLINFGMNCVLNGTEHITIWTPAFICVGSILLSSWLSIGTKRSRYSVYAL